MRKIVSKENEAKRRKRNQIIVGVILVVVMFGSVFGIVVRNFGTNESNEGRIMYNGIEFLESNDYWFATIGNIDFVFKYNPEEVVAIQGDVDKLNKYVDIPLYVYSEDELSEIEIYRNLQNIAERTQRACYDGLACPNENLPTKTCEDNFIIIRESNETNIIQNESCVYITGKKEDLVKTTDEFLFKVSGIKD